MGFFPSARPLNVLPLDPVLLAERLKLGLAVLVLADELLEDLLDLQLGSARISLTGPKAMREIEREREGERSGGEGEGEG